MIKLIQLLKEVLNELGNSMGGYTMTRVPKNGVDKVNAPLKDYRDSVTYTFQDDEGNKYWIDIYLNMYDRLDVDFNEEDAGDYIRTNRKKQYKIVTTIANAIQKELVLDKQGVIQGIDYTPAYEDKDWKIIDKKRKQGQDVGGDNPVNQRDQLYRAFITKRLEMLKKWFPNAQVKSNHDGTVVNLNRQKK